VKNTFFFFCLRFTVFSFHIFFISYFSRFCFPFSKRKKILRNISPSISLQCVWFCVFHIYHFEIRDVKSFFTKKYINPSQFLFCALLSSRNAFSTAEIFLSVVLCCVVWKFRGWSTLYSRYDFRAYRTARSVKMAKNVTQDGMKMVKFCTKSPSRRPGSTFLAIFTSRAIREGTIDEAGCIFSQVAHIRQAHHNDRVAVISNQVVQLPLNLSCFTKVYTE